MKQKKTYNLRATTFAMLTTVGLVLQLHAIELARLERGRFALGGEWLTLPLVYLVYVAIMETIDFFELGKKGCKYGKVKKAQKDWE